jgi:hypothetical protein
VPAWGDGIVVSESEGRELEVIEKRQNEANLPVVLIIDILRLRTNKRGIEQEKRTQFPAGGKGGSNEWRQNSGQWSVNLEAVEWPASPGRFVCLNSAFSQHFSTFYGSSVQALDTQLNALPPLAVRARTVSGCLNSAFSRHF